MHIVGVVIVVLLLIPNILYAFKNKNIENKCKNKVLNGLEQVGRYGAMILMFLPIGIPEFGFWSKDGFVIWLIAIPVLLLLYWIVLFVYLSYHIDLTHFQKPTPFRFFNISRQALAMLLAILPGIIFILHGIVMAHWLLILFSVVFTITHIMVTYKNYVAA